MDQTELSTIQTAITGVSALAACLSAIFTAVTVRASSQARQATLESERPYFSFYGFGLERPRADEPLGSEPKVLAYNRAVIEWRMANRGVRPASNVSCALFILPLVDGRREVQVFRIVVADEVVSGIECEVRSSQLQLFSGNVLPPGYIDPGYFICVALQYDDPLTSKHYGQLSFMRWPGICDNKVTGNFVAADKEERDALLAKHSALLQPYRESKH
jgi:hypothetical protein